ncbi:sensor histidine kinase [Streptomyces xantholiticus]|uniref:sensor histidine kinase n=1 Tax=Streptomyces xantholiticus TaxID=68285 RepID=UPI00167661EC|nr:ATP-binding protein [Streptomyces xantholiticus]GGW55676.1 two-component sensor histidine kinase [Streptomyces xantholiticus]
MKTASAVQIAEHLNEHKEDILAVYWERLRNSPSVLLRDPEVLSALRRQAAQTLSICADVLYSEGAFLDGIEPEPRELVAAGRTFRHLHPTETLRAASLLYDVVMDELTPMAGDPYSLTLAARTLHQTMMWRMEAMTTGYDAFLYRRFKEGYVAERFRLARDIHDHVSNSMTACLRSLELFEFHEGRNDTVARTNFERARSTLLESMSGMQRVIFELRHTSPLEQLGTSLQKFLNSVQGGNHITATVTGNECWLSPEYREELFLIVREALRNVLAHSGTAHAAVRVDVTPHHARAVIEDEGIGFDVPSVLNTGQDHGLSAMRERTEELGGRLTLTSAPGEGTVIDVLVPLPECECDRAPE